jgi:hypothetical protein
MKKRVSWADLLDEEEESPPSPARPRPKRNPVTRRLPKQNPAAPFLAARTLYNSIRAGKMGVDEAIRSAKHLEDVSPDAAELLWIWLRSS